MLIFIIGYMGSGKTTFGKRLAAELRYRFIDLDELLMLETGYSIWDLFQRYGEEAFRQKEKQLLQSIIAGIPPFADTNNDTDIDIVIATGGGTPCYGNNMEMMSENGITVFLDTPYEVLLERLVTGNMHRPLLKDIPGEQIPGFIKVHLASRMKYYEEARIIVRKENGLLDVIRAIKETTR